MKSNIVLMAILAVYLFVLAAVYTVWNLIDHGGIEWVGSVSILLSGVLAAFIGFYLNMVLKAQGGVLVEDMLDADVDDGDPELGEFSPWSWWPIVLAGSIAFVFLGICIGYQFWMAFLAVPLVLVAVIGWVYEYYRGHFAR